MTPIPGVNNERQYRATDAAGAPLSHKYTIEAKKAVAFIPNALAGDKDAMKLGWRELGALFINHYGDLPKKQAMILPHVEAYPNQTPSQLVIKPTQLRMVLRKPVKVQSRKTVRIE